MEKDNLDNLLRIASKTKVIEVIAEIEPKDLREAKYLLKMIRDVCNNN